MSAPQTPAPDADRDPRAAGAADMPVTGSGDGSAPEPAPGAAAPPPDFPAPAPAGLSAAALVRRALPAIAPGRGLSALRLRGRVIAAALRHRAALTALARDPSPALAQIARTRPHVLVGPLVWPYLCAGWDAEARLSRLTAHYRAVDGLGAPFPFDPDSRLVLAELDDIHPGLRLVMDQPRWFIREGGLTLNLFVDDFRAYSLAFSLADLPEGGRELLIGGLQGRNTEAANDLYRDLTKDAHGLRPRDLLLEACRILARHWDVRKMRGVRDSERHHHHPFFSGKKIAPQDYDGIWRDRGGVLEGTQFWTLPVAPDRRPDEEIKPNKRSLYRRRYRFLDALEQDMLAALPDRQAVRFADR